MGRLSRFAGHRFIGTRDDLVVYDCDDVEQFDLLEELVRSEDLVGRGLVATFGPDTLAEARNRGFSECRPRPGGESAD